MSIMNVNDQTMDNLMEAVNSFLSTYLQKQKSLDKAVKHLTKDKTQDKLREALKTTVDEIASTFKKTRSPRSPREKKLKDPDAPKGVRSAYILFCQDKRSHVAKKNPDMAPKDIMKEMGKLWKGLSPRKKEKYKKLSLEDKARHEEQMKEYEELSQDEIESKLRAMGKRPRRRSGDKGKKSKGKKDPNAPKRPVSAYLLFSKDMRAQVKEANPNMDNKEVTKETGRMWREDVTTDKQRKKWMKQAAKDKKRYEAEIADYTPPEGVSTPQSKRSKGPKKSNGFILFCAEHRAQAKTALEDPTFGNVQKQLSAMWKEADEYDVEEYNRKAAEINEANGIASPKKSPKKTKTTPKLKVKKVAEPVAEPVEEADDEDDVQSEDEDDNAPVVGEDDSSVSEDSESDDE